MKCRGLIAALMAIGLIAESAGIAAAHTPSDYPYEWTYSVTSRVFYYKASYPTGWPRDRFVDAMAKWNNVSGASLTFSAGGAAQASDSSCGPRDIISEQHIDGVGHNLAITVTCSTPNSTVHILVDEDDPFDNGAGTPNDPAKWDLQSTLTHELGHATRGWVLCTSPTGSTTMTLSITQFATSLTRRTSPRCATPVHRFRRWILGESAR
jgi:hypothetical protein